MIWNILKIILKKITTKARDIFLMCFSDSFSVLWGFEIFLWGENRFDFSVICSFTASVKTQQRKIHKKRLWKRLNIPVCWLQIKLLNCFKWINRWVMVLSSALIVWITKYLDLEKFQTNLPSHDLSYGNKRCKNKLTKTSQLWECWLTFCCFNI